MLVVVKGPLHGLVLGGDGYLGWRRAMRLAARGNVLVVDHDLRRNLARETSAEPLIAAPNLGERAAISCTLVSNVNTNDHEDCLYAVCESGEFSRRVARHGSTLSFRDIQPPHVRR